MVQYAARWARLSMTVAQAQFPFCAARVALPEAAALAGRFGPAAGHKGAPVVRRPCGPFCFGL